MKLIHYRKTCIGCNSCVEHSPKNWKIADDGKADLLNAKEKNGVFILEIDESTREESEAAAKDCPMRIIKIEK